MAQDGKDELLGREEQARAQERKAAVLEKLRHDVKEMLEVLKADIPGFYAREGKRRFLAAHEFAEKLDDRKIAQLKKDVQAAGEKVAAEVVRALEPQDIWMWDRSPLPDAPKTLDPNPRVASALARIGQGLAEVLSKHGLPDAESAKDSWKLPSYFVAGRFMKSLVESYWRNLQELVELTRLLDESSSRERRERLGNKWDKA